MGDEYPTDEELEAIRLYEGDAAGMFELLKPIWHWGIRDEWIDGSRLFLATGGWSGNESIIEALKGNFVFWMMNWYQSRRGGAYWFRFDRKDWSEA